MKFAVLGLFDKSGLYIQALKRAAIFRKQTQQVG
jgi:hypothetical protein